MSLSEKTNFGATIADPPTALNTTIPYPDDTSLPDAKNPCSAFYSHPCARRSFQDDRPPTATSAKGHLAPRIFTHDLESQSALSHHATLTPKISVDGRHGAVRASKECTAWPSKATLLEKQRAVTRQKGAWGRMRCRWAEMSARRRVGIQILLALFVIATAVGLGVGISRAVGGKVWVAEGRNKEIES